MRGVKPQALRTKRERLQMADDWWTQAHAAIDYFKCTPRSLGNWERGSHKPIDVFKDRVIVFMETSDVTLLRFSKSLREVSCD